MVWHTEWISTSVKDREPVQGMKKQMGKSDLRLEVLRILLWLNFALFYNSNSMQSWKFKRLFISFSMSNCRAEEIYGDYREFRAILSSNGRIRWEPGGVFKTMCEIDITYFPFDQQVTAEFSTKSIIKLRNRDNINFYLLLCRHVNYVVANFLPKKPS